MEWDGNVFRGVVFVRDTSSEDPRVPPRPDWAARLPLFEPTKQWVLDAPRSDGSGVIYGWMPAREIQRPVESHRRHVHTDWSPPFED